MFECEMAGCFDTAEYLAVIDGKDETLEVCQGCADFWRNQKDEAITIKGLEHAKKI